MKLSSFHERAYGRWGGRPAGTPADPAKCCASVTSADTWHTSQCSRKRGHGPEEAYCRQHDPAFVEKKRAASKEKYDKESAVWWVKANGPKMLAALKQIAEGHNDARGLAASIIKQVERK